MVDTGEDEGFRVTDRRRRASDLEGESQKSEPAAEVSRGPVRQAPRPPAPEPEPKVGAPPAGYDTQGRDLTGLFMMLASSAVVALGEAADPLTGEVRREPEQAAETIDLLVLLREKTEGHRTAEETQLLEAIIYDLQMRYINVLKQP